MSLQTRAPLFANERRLTLRCAMFLLSFFPPLFLAERAAFAHTRTAHTQNAHTHATAATLFHKPDVKSVYCMQRSFPPRLFYSRAVCRGWGRGVWTDGRTVSDVRSRLCTLAVCVCVRFVVLFRPSLRPPSIPCVCARRLRLRFALDPPPPPEEGRVRSPYSSDLA